MIEKQTLSIDANGVGSNKIIYTNYKEGKEITLVCSFYRNPIYNKIVPGFGLKVEDREEPNNNAVQYPSWNYKIENLGSQPLPDPIKFDFYINNSDAPTTDPVPI